MFFVVEFKNGSVKVVPDNWLLEDGKVCYWLPSRGMKIMRDIKEMCAKSRSLYALDPCQTWASISYGNTFYWLMD